MQLITIEKVNVKREEMQSLYTTGFSNEQYLYTITIRLRMIIDLTKNGDTRKLCFRKAKSSATTVENKILTGAIQSSCRRMHFPLCSLCSV